MQRCRKPVPGLFLCRRAYKQSRTAHRAGHTIPLHPQGRRGRFPFRCGAAIPSVGLRPPDPERHRNSPARHTVQDPHPPAPHRQDRHPSVPHAGPASLCSPCRTGILLPIFVRRRSPSQAAQVPQPGGAGPPAKRSRSSSQAEQVRFLEGLLRRLSNTHAFQRRRSYRKKLTCARMPQDLRRDAPGPAPASWGPAPYYCLPCGDGTLAPLWIPSRRGRRRNEPSSLP